MEIIHLAKLVRTIYICSTFHIHYNAFMMKIERQSVLYLHHYYYRHCFCHCRHHHQSNCCCCRCCRRCHYHHIVDAVTIAFYCCCYYANRYFTTKFICTVWHNLYCIFPFIKSNWTINWNLFHSFSLLYIHSHSLILCGRHNLLLYFQIETVDALERDD